MTDNPAPVLQPPVMHWKLRHTAAVLGITIFFVWMALWRPWGAYASWIVAMAGLSLFTLIVGRGVTGVWKGAFVDDRFRMSLSRLQIIAWTIVVLSAFGVIAVMRAQRDPVTAMDIAVPETIWALLGISTTSMIGSPLIKNAKKTASSAPSDEKAKALVETQGKSPDGVTWEGRVVKNKSIGEASVADLFRGEYLDDFALLDVAKIQMFFFTALLIFSYAVSVGRVLLMDPYPPSLPDVGSGMLPLLGISHAGYLASKAATGPAKTS